MATLDELTVRIGADADDLESGLGKAAQAVEDNIGKITAAGVAAGGAMEGFARGQAASNDTLARTSVITGESSDALRELAVDLSDGQTAASDNAAAFELLAQKGFDTREEFEELTPKINDFATAVGKDAPEAINTADRLLAPFGESLADVGENSDQMSRLIAETDIPLGTLERNLGRVPDELQALEFGLDDAAAGIEYFRDEGYSGQESVREFRRAVADSEGDMDTFLENIGLTAEEWESYQNAVEPAAGLTDELAEANSAAVTPMQELQQHAENLMFQYGDLATLAGNLAPVLLALGPIFKGLALAKGLFSAALWASPITWIVLGIMALIAVVVLLIVYWDEIAAATSAAWAWIMDALGAAWAWIVDLFWSAVDWLVEAVASGLEWLLDLFMSWHPVGIVISHWDEIVAAFNAGVDWAVDLVVGLVEDVLAFLARLAQIPGMVGDFFRDMYQRAQQQGQNLLSFVRSIPSRITSALGNLGNLLRNAGRSVIQGLINGIKSMISNIGSTMSNVAGTIRDFLPFSPAKEGPLSGDGAPEVSGARIAETLGEGVFDQLREIDRAADALMRPLDERMADTRTQMRDVTRHIPSNINQSVRHVGREGDTLTLDVTGTDGDLKRMIRKMVKNDGRGDVQTAFGRR